MNQFQFSHFIMDDEYLDLCKNPKADHDTEQTHHWNLFMKRGDTRHLLNIDLAKICGWKTMLWLSEDFGPTFSHLVEGFTKLGKLRPTQGFRHWSWVAIAIRVMMGKNMFLFTLLFTTALIVNCAIVPQTRGLYNTIKAHVSSVIRVDGPEGLRDIPFDRLAYFVKPLTIEETFAHVIDLKILRADTDVEQCMRILTLEAEKYLIESFEQMEYKRSIAFYHKQAAQLCAHRFLRDFRPASPWVPKTFHKGDRVLTDEGYLKVCLTEALRYNIIHRVENGISGLFIVSHQG